MRQTKWSKVVCMMLACALMSVAAVRAADAPATPPGGGGGRNFDPAKMREQIQTRLKEQMGTTDDEWKALQPKIDDMMKIQSQTRTSTRGLFSRPGGATTD